MIPTWGMESEFNQQYFDNCKNVKRGGTGWYSMILGQWKAVVVGTWWYLVIIGWY